MIEDVVGQQAGVGLPYNRIFELIVLGAGAGRAKGGGIGGH